MNWAHQFEIIKEISSKKISSTGGRFSLAQLDRLLGITPGKSRHWDKGQRPSADDLELMARKLDLSPKWLLLREGDPLREENPSSCAGALPADPIVQRLIEAERILRAANAPDETIRQAVFEVLRGQDAPANRTDEESAAPEFRKVGNGG